MKIIAHRGLLFGPDATLENDPTQVERALAAGFDVEVDVWFESVPDTRPNVEEGAVRDSWWLGHNGPVYEVSVTFLQRPGIWIHCKNTEALNHMTPDMHFFWHADDDYTLTSQGVVWCYPGKDLTYMRQCVAVLPERALIEAGAASGIADIADALLVYSALDSVISVCTDYGGAMLDAFDRRRRETQALSAAVPE